MPHSITGPSSVTVSAEELVPATPADVNASSLPVGTALNIPSAAAQSAGKLVVSYIHISSASIGIL